MNILVLGSGVIGTTYAYALQQAGHTVEHFVRQPKRESLNPTVTIRLLDGRGSPKGIQKTDSYTIHLAQPGGKYDFIIVSVPLGKLAEAVNTLRKNNFKGTLLLFCGIDQDRQDIARWVGEYPSILGFPVAGGAIHDGTLDCVLFDHIMLERSQNAAIAHYPDLVQLFASADIKTECPYDMLEWIWIHMAINAAVTSTAAKYADATNPAKAADALMNSAKMLSEVVLVIRETLKIVQARGVNLKNYRGEILPYNIPSWLAGPIMKRMFASSELTRKIMQLHGNIADIMYVCQSVYDHGQQLGIKAPLFYENYQAGSMRFGNSTAK